MALSDRHLRVPVGLLLVFFLGCAVPSPATPPLTAAAARHTLDNWNSNYCKIAEFYGFYKAQGEASSQVAYVLMVNPSDKAQKPTVFAARSSSSPCPMASKNGF